MKYKLLIFDLASFIDFYTYSNYIFLIYEVKYCRDESKPVRKFFEDRKNRYGKITVNEFLDYMCEETGKSRFELLKQGMYLLHETLNNGLDYNSTGEMALKLITIPKVIITNIKSRYALPAVKHFGLDKYFDRVITPETYGIKKPDPYAVFRMLDEYNVKPSETLFHGDDIKDYECAKKAGVVFCPAMKGPARHTLFDLPEEFKIGTVSMHDLLDIVMAGGKGGIIW